MFLGITIMDRSEAADSADQTFRGSREIGSGQFGRDEGLVSRLVRSSLLSTQDSYSSNFNLGRAAVSVRCARPEAGD